MTRLSCLFAAPLSRHAGFFALAAFLIAAAPAGPAAAHPHAWIDVQVEVRFDAKGRATAIRQIWLFDPAYTAFAVEGLGKNGVPTHKDLDDLLRLNMKNLKEYRYFTRVRQDGKTVPYGAVSKMSSRMAGKRLEMSFVLPLVSTVPVASGRLTYAIFDPTYYIEMVHAQRPDAVRLVGARDGCTARIAQPIPSAEAVALASSLDRTQSAGDGLGELFAETVTIECAAPR